MDDRIGVATRMSFLAGALLMGACGGSEPDRSTNDDSDEDDEGSAEVSDRGGATDDDDDDDDGDDGDDDETPMTARDGGRDAMTGPGSRGTPDSGGRAARPDARVGGGGDAAGPPADAGSGVGMPNDNTDRSAAAPSAGCGAEDPLASGRASIDVSGTMREYILSIPEPYDANKPYKLIFGWHPLGGNAETVAGGRLGGGAYHGLQQRAAGSAIFVAPEGLNQGWSNTGGRDIAFLRAMLEVIQSGLCIDQNRIFSTGFSYGGMMSDTIGCQMSDVFRAIAPMSGSLMGGCNVPDGKPIAVWMSHGDNDTVVQTSWGESARDYFVRRNQCQPETMPTEPSPCVAYQGCASGAPLHWCIFPGGHTPPTFASQAIWEFFSQF